MNEGKRAWDLVRGYAGQLSKEWDRLSSIEMVAAERELAESKDELPKTETVTTQVPIPQDPAERLAQARKIIGVTETSSFSEIRKVYERLLKRCDPANFQAGSIEGVQAATIRRRVEWAYGVISENRGSSEKRFGSLEID